MAQFSPVAVMQHASFCWVWLGEPAQAEIAATEILTRFASGNAPNEWPGNATFARLAIANVRAQQGEVEEAARIDGAGYWRIYWNIILPLSRPIMSALAILFFLANWNSFLWPLTIASDPDLWVVQVGIANFKSQYAASWNYMMAASTIVAIPTLVLFVIFQRQIMDSLKTSGLK